MSSISALAIIGAIRERCVGAVAGTRSMAAGALASNIYPTLPDGEKARRALIVPRVDVRIVQTGRSPASMLSENGNRQIVRCDIRVMTVYAITPSAKASEASAATLYVSELDGIRALAIYDAELVRQSLTWPGALTTWQAVALPTGIVSGCLLQQDTGANVIDERAEAGASFLQVEMQFFAHVEVAPATS